MRWWEVEGIRFFFYYCCSLLVGACLFSFCLCCLYDLLTEVASLLIIIFFFFHHHPITSKSTSKCHCNCFLLVVSRTYRSMTSILWIMLTKSHPSKQTILIVVYLWDLLVIVRKLGTWIVPKYHAIIIKCWIWSYFLYG